MGSAKSALSCPGLQGKIGSFGFVEKQENVRPEYLQIMRKQNLDADAIVQVFPYHFVKLLGYESASS